MLKRYNTVGTLEGVEEVTLEQLIHSVENLGIITVDELKAIQKVIKIAKKYNLK